MRLLTFIWSVFSFDHYENYGGGGESNWTKFWFQLLASILAVGGAMFVAYKAFQWNKKKEELIKNREKEESEISLLNYVYYSLVSMLADLSIQKLHLEKFIELLDIDSPDTIRMGFKDSLSFNWYESIDKIKLRDSFFNRLRNEKENIKITVLFYKLVTETDSLRNAQISLKSFLKEFLDEYTLIEKKYTNAFSIFLKSISLILSNNDESSTVVNAKKKILNISQSLSDLGEDKQKRYKFTYDNFIIPILTILENNAVLLDYSVAENIKNLYIDLKVCLDTSRSIFDSYHEAFKNGAANLEEITAVLSELPELNINSK
jgi:hypothetical protein